MGLSAEYEGPCNAKVGETQGWEVVEVKESNIEWFYVTLCHSV